MHQANGPTSRDPTVQQPALEEARAVLAALLRYCPDIAESFYFQGVPSGLANSAALISDPIRILRYPLHSERKEVVTDDDLRSVITIVQRHDSGHSWQRMVNKLAILTHTPLLVGQSSKAFQNFLDWSSRNGLEVPWTVTHPTPTPILLALSNIAPEQCRTDSILCLSYDVELALKHKAADGRLSKELTTALRGLAETSRVLCDFPTHSELLATAQLPGGLRLPGPLFQAPLPHEISHTLRSAPTDLIALELALGQCAAPSASTLLTRISSLRKALCESGIAESCMPNDVVLEQLRHDFLITPQRAELQREFAISRLKKSVAYEHNVIEELFFPGPKDSEWSRQPRYKRGLGAPGSCEILLARVAIMESALRCEPRIKAAVSAQLIEFADLESWKRALAERPELWSLKLWHSHHIAYESAELGREFSRAVTAFVRDNHKTSADRSDELTKKFFTQAWDGIFDLTGNPKALDQRVKALLNEAPGE